MHVFAQAVEGTLVTGAVYGLVGAGFVLLFRASKVLSFAQGGFVLLGAYLFYDLVTHSVPWVLAAAIAVAAASVLSTVLYVAFFARVAARDHFTTSVATIGLAAVLTAVIAIHYGQEPLTLPDVMSTKAYHVFSAVVPVVDIVVFVFSVLFVVALLLLLKYTPIGMRMNAVADNVTLSAHLGVQPARIAAIAWALAGATAGVAGVAFSLRFSVDPTSVSNIGLLAFPAIILGGLDSLGGAVIGGILIAGIQNAVQTTMGAEWINIVSFAIMLLILLVRPSGLFGRAEVVRL